MVTNGLNFDTGDLTKMTLEIRPSGDFDIRDYQPTPTSLVGALDKPRFLTKEHSKAVFGFRESLYPFGLANPWKSFLRTRTLYEMVGTDFSMEEDL